MLGKLDHWADQEAGVGGDILRLAMPYDTMPAQYHWQQLLNLGTPLVDAPYPEAEQVMTLIYTSGSTGKPKGAIQTFGSYGWTCNAVVRDLKTDGKDRLLRCLCRKPRQLCCRCAANAANRVLLGTSAVDPVPEEHYR